MFSRFHLYQIIGSLSRVSAGALLVVLAILQPVFAQTPPFFTDIQENNTAYPAVFELKKTGVIQGYSDNTFRPDQPVSRAEAVALLLKITNQAGSFSAEKNYTDAAKDAWYFPFVQKASELNIVKGFPDGTFRPNNPVKMAEAAKMTFAAFSFPVSSAKPDEAWYAPYFVQAAKKNFFYDFRKDAPPDTAMTRGNFAKLLFRARNVKDTAGKPFDITLEWRDFLNDTNYYTLQYPRNWEVFKGKNNSAFWKRDAENLQAWFTRIFPNSMRVSISFQETANCKWQRTEDPTQRDYDAVVCLPNGKSLIIYGDYGENISPEFAKNQIQLMLDSIRYVEPKPQLPPPLTPAEKVEKAREQMLILGKGADILKMFEDKRLIETDTMGVGTGPVDYYYSQEADVTIKYERNSKTILDIRSSQTTRF